MTASTALETKLYIGTTAGIDFSTDENAVDDFELDSYTAVTGIVDLGEFGDESNEVAYATLDDGRTRRGKGRRDAGVLALICARDPLDAGQQALVAAEKVKDEYNIKIVANDAPVGGTPTTYYMRVLVMSAKNSYGNGDDIVQTTFNLAINTAIIEVTAAEAVSPESP